MKEKGRDALVAWLWILSTSVLAAAQTLSPPIAEYRRKANGVLELRNNGDTPLATILELRGFAVDAQGNMKYVPLDPGITVELGSNSFTIPPHQAHYVFYKASSALLPAWFAIMNTMTQATPASGGMRINIVLPHLVYLYQKPKLKKQDVRVRIFPGNEAGEYGLEFENLSGKMGRVGGVDCRGFEVNQTYGGFPLFPHQTRRLSLKTGAPSDRARFRIRFEDGFRLEESVPATASPGASFH